MIVLDTPNKTIAPYYDCEWQLHCKSLEQRVSRLRTLTMTMLLLNDVLRVESCDLFVNTISSKSLALLQYVTPLQSLLQSTN